VDAFDRAPVVGTGDEDNRRAANLAEPSRRLDPFAATGEANVHQGNVGTIPHGKRAGPSIAGRELANVEAEIGHDKFQVEGTKEVVLDDQSATARGRYLPHGATTFLVVPLFD
jgi:hypothetical protein